MGLRLAEGIDPRRYAALSGRALDPRRIALLREEGAIVVDDRRPAAGDAGRIPGARCGGGGSRGVIVFLRRTYAAEKLFGEPGDRPTPPAPSRRRITARPRSLVPSGRKRNRPSMPAKPDGLVSTSGEKRCRPCVRAKRRDQRHRVIGERRGSHRLAAVFGAVAAGEAAEAGRIRRGIEAALQGRAREHARIVPQAGAEQLDVLQVGAGRGQRIGRRHHRIAVIGDEQRIRRTQRLRHRARRRWRGRRRIFRTRRCGRPGGRTACLKAASTTLP